MAPAARPSNAGLDLEEDESDYGIQKADRKVVHLQQTADEITDSVGSGALVTQVTVCNAFQGEIKGER